MHVEKHFLFNNRNVFFYSGVELGEIGARFAHEAGDNGYLRLTNVRIPRNQMLMKLAHVYFFKQR